MYKSVIFLFIMIISLSSCSEKFGRRYVSKKYDREMYIDSSPGASKNRDIKNISKDSVGNTIITTFSKDSVLKSIETVDNEKDKNNIGVAMHYFPDGKLKSIIYYGSKNSFSQIKTYYPNGTLKRDDNYSKDTLLLGACYDSLGSIIPYFEYEVIPKVDLERLSSCLVYPDILKREGCEEMISLRLLISDTKKVRIIKYDSDHSTESIQEVIRCIKKLNNDPDNFIIEPARIDGEAINCWVTIPIKFRLR